MSRLPTTSATAYGILFAVPACPPALRQAGAGRIAARDTQAIAPARCFRRRSRRSECWCVLLPPATARVPRANNHRIETMISASTHLRFIGKGGPRTARHMPIQCQDLRVDVFDSDPGVEKPRLSRADPVGIYLIRAASRAAAEHIAAGYPFAAAGHWALTTSSGTSSDPWAWAHSPMAEFPRWSTCAGVSINILAQRDEDTTREQLPDTMDLRPAISPGPQQRSAHSSCSGRAPLDSAGDRAL